MKDRSDQQLLASFAQEKSDASFAEVVRRYVDLVYSTSLRLTGDSHLAEDVSQAVFIALAQHAGTIANKLANGAPLSGWLHLTTRNQVGKVIRSEVRRRHREKEAVAMNELSTNEQEHCSLWDQIAPHLDDAIGELPESDRDALLLRFFERQTAREIGLRLGLSEDAAQKRLSRALERLRSRFAARGLAFPASLGITALASVLSTQVVHAAPAALLGSLTTAAVAASASAPIGLAAWSANIFSVLTMNKAQVAILSTVIATMAVPIIVQQSKLVQLRSTVAARSSSTVDFNASSPTNSSEPFSAASVQSEIERLTRLRSDLSARLTEKQNVRNTSPAFASRTPGPTLLGMGRTISVDELEYAGNATPEAALQSSLVALRETDLEGFFALALLPPDNVDKMNELLATPEGRQQMKQEWLELLQGVVRESAVKLGPDNTVVDRYEGKKYPDNPAGTVAYEMLDSRQLDDRRVELRVNVLHGSDRRTETFTFGLTSNGWKQLMFL